MGDNDEGSITENSEKPPGHSIFELPKLLITSTSFRARGRFGHRNPVVNPLSKSPPLYPLSETSPPNFSSTRPNDDALFRFPVPVTTVSASQSFTESSTRPVTAHDTHVSQECLLSFGPDAASKTIVKTADDFSRGDEFSLENRRLEEQNLNSNVSVSSALSRSPSETAGIRSRVLHPAHSPAAKSSGATPIGSTSQSCEQEESIFDDRVESKKFCEVSVSDISRPNPANSSTAKSSSAMPVGSTSQSCEQEKSIFDDRVEPKKFCEVSGPNLSRPNASNLPASSCDAIPASIVEQDTLCADSSAGLLEQQCGAICREADSCDVSMSGEFATEQNELKDGQLLGERCEEESCVMRPEDAFCDIRMRADLSAEGNELKGGQPLGLINCEADACDIRTSGELPVEGNELARDQLLGDRLMQECGLTSPEDDGCDALTRGEFPAEDHELEDGQLSEKFLEQHCSVKSPEADTCDNLARREIPAEEHDLEDGELSGDWTGNDDSEEDTESLEPYNFVSVTEDDGNRNHFSGRGRDSEVPGVRVDASDDFYFTSEPAHTKSEQFSQANGTKKGIKKNKKHRKGQGSQKRAREKSRDKYNEILKKRKTEGKAGHAFAHVEMARDSQLQGSQKTVRGDKPLVEEGPEDGEYLLDSTETNNGQLSSLVEAEVGLWTTDVVDDLYIAQMEQEGGKKRGPETAERKRKRKIVKRKKRAQKERELGFRRPPRLAQSKQVKVLCTHYMKGRCLKGEKCTFSHDAVPLTKLEPCKFLMNNSCLKGDDCPYSHNLQAFPCKFFHTRGLCYDGANCQFSHAAISDEAKEKLLKRVEKEKKDRLSSATGLDFPSTKFSTPLPPEMDPDPLGWGPSSSYRGSEGFESSNVTGIDSSTLLYADSKLKIHPTEGLQSSNLTIMGSSTLLCEDPKLEIHASDSVSVATDKFEGADKCEDFMFHGGATAVGFGSMVDMKVQRREAERYEVHPTQSKSEATSFPLAHDMGTSEFEAVHKCRDSMMDAGITFSELGSMIDMKSHKRAADTLMPPNPASSPGISHRPLERERWLGNRHVSFQRVGMTAAKGVQTVDSLLNEALNG